MSSGTFTNYTNKRTDGPYQDEMLLTKQTYFNLGGSQININKTYKSTRKVVSNGDFIKEIKKLSKTKKVHEQSEKQNQFDNFK